MEANLLDKYFINKKGYIFNIKTGKNIKWQDNGHGYKKVTLTIGGKQIQKYVHRLVGEVYLNNYNNKPQINHKNGIKSDNRVENLEWCDGFENQKHAVKIGLRKKGNELWNGKFTDKDIIKIFTLKNNGIKQNKISEFFNCSKSTICEILSGKRYKHIIYIKELTLKTE